VAAWNVVMRERGGARPGDAAGAAVPAGAAS